MLIIGALLIGSSFYIKSQVEAGQKKVTSAEKQTEIGEQLFSLNPATKELGEGLTGSVKEKISEGKEQIEFYTALAKWLEIGGILFAVLGVGLMLPGKKSKS